MDDLKPRQLLDLAERDDGYRASIEASVPNRLAREGQEYTPFFVGPSAAQRLSEEMDAIELLGDANIIVMHPSAESGMPHTRPRNIVCMPASYVETAGRNELADTLRHEAIHVHQRNNPKRWDTFCRREGWEPVQDPVQQIPQQYRLACRLNPDTFRAPHPFWAWDGAYVTLPILIPKPQPTLRDCEIRWLDLRAQRIVAEPPPSFQKRYGRQPPQPEHPYELFAVECAQKGIGSERALESYLRSY